MMIKLLKKCDSVFHKTFIFDEWWIRVTKTVMVARWNQVKNR